MYTVYVLHSLSDKNFYIGCTTNMEKRLEYHQKGKVTSTKHRLPVELIYREEYQERHEAFKIERFYKTPKGKKILKGKII